MMKAKKQRHVFLLYGIFALCLLLFLLPAWLHKAAVFRLKQHWNQARLIPCEKFTSWESEIGNAAHQLACWESQRVEHRGEPKATDKRRLEDLSQLEIISGMTGGFYLIHKDGHLLTTSGLPVGHPSMVTNIEEQTFYTVPYERSSDHQSVVSLFCLVDPEWILAGDFSLDSITQQLLPSSTESSFFCLLDNRSEQILAYPDSHYQGQRLADLSDPLLQDIGKAMKHNPKASVVKAPNGQRYYRIVAELKSLSLQNTNWMMAYFQTECSLFREVLLTGAGFWGKVFCYLLWTGLFGGILFSIVNKKQR